MSYIDNNILPDEKILFRTQKHLIIFFVPCVFLIVTLLLLFPNPISNVVYGTIHDIFKITSFENDIQRLPLVVMFFILLYSFGTQWLTYATSEYAVTTQRVIMKQGFFNRYVCDTRLSAISHVTVDQNLLAQALNYGVITINSFGGTSDTFTDIASPNAFQKNVQGLLGQK